MGLKQFSEFVDELQMELGERTDLTSLGGVNFLKTWVNSAYITVTTKNRFWNVRRNFYFPQLETFTTVNTSDGDSSIDVPTDCIVARHVWDSTNDVPLQNISFQDYTKYTGRADTTAEGEPTQWTRHGSNIYLYPTPDDTYTMYIYYRKRPAEMVSDDDTTVVGAEWDEPILRVAKVLSLRKLNQHDEAKREQEYAEDLIKDVVGIYDQETIDREDYRKVHLAYLNYRY